MTRRLIRAARKAGIKRTFGEPADFDMPEPLTAEPMTPEEAEQFSLDYQRDAIAENTGPAIPGRY